MPKQMPIHDDIAYGTPLEEIFPLEMYVEDQRSYKLRKVMGYPALEGDKSDGVLLSKPCRYDGSQSQNRYSRCTDSLNTVDRVFKREELIERSKAEMWRVRPAEYYFPSEQLERA